MLSIAFGLWYGEVHAVCGCVGRVVALVPQIDLRDFDCCTRADMTAAHKDELRAAIARACDELADGETDAQATDGDKNINDARVVIHVGREADDLHQLSYLPRVVAGSARSSLRCAPRGPPSSISELLPGAGPGGLRRAAPVQGDLCLRAVPTQRME